MDSSTAPAPVPTGATTIGGVQVLPIRLPTLPPALEAVVLGVAHSLVAAPVLYAVATPALGVVARHWVTLVYSAGLELARWFVVLPWRQWWRYDHGISHSSLRLVLLTVVMAAAVHVLTLPLQAGARRRARIQPRSLPLYALGGGLGLAGALWWSGLVPMLLYRSPYPLVVIGLVGWMAAGRVALAGRRARLERSEVREVVRELAVAGASFVGLLLATIAAVAGSLLTNGKFLWVAVGLVGVPALAAFTWLGLRPLRDLILAASARPQALPATAAPASLPAGND